MVKSKTIDIIKSLSPDELKEARSFVISPYFNKHKILVKLFDEIKSFYPDFNQKDFTPENLYTKLYKSKEYNDRTFKNIISELFKLLKRFLCQIEIDTKRDFEKKIFLLWNLNGRSLNDIFLKNYESFKKELDNSKINLDFFLERGKLSDVRNQNLMCQGRERESPNVCFTCRESKFLDTLMFLPMSITDMEVFKNDFGLEPEVNITKLFLENFNFENFLSKIKKHPEHKLIEFSYYLVMLCTAKHPEDLKYYNEVLNYLKENYKNIHKEFLFNISIQLQNFLFGKNSDPVDPYEFCRYKLDLYKFMIETKIFLDEKEVWLHVVSFINVVQTASFLDEVDWLEKFINEYINYIDPDKRESMYHYAHCVLEYNRGKLDKSLEHISKMKQNIPNLQIIMRYNSLFIYYDLNYFNQFYCAHEAFMKDILYRNTHQPHKKEANVNSLKLMKKLMRLKENADRKPDKILLFKKELEKNKNKIHHIHFKWLKNKSEELGGD